MPAAKNVISFPAKPQKETQERFTRRKDGLYQLEKRYTMPDGTSKKKSFYGKTQAEAIAKRRDFERELDAGANLDLLNVKLADYIDIYLSTFKKGVRKNTLDAYRCNADVIKEMCGNKRVRDITLSDVQTIVNTKDGMSKSLVTKFTSLLRAIFDTARADRIITYSPCDKMIMPRYKEGTHRAITTVERELITESCLDHRFHVAAMLMLYAGLRRGEAMALNIARDVDFEAGTINVVQTVYHEGNTPFLGPPKTKAGIRSIPILPPLQALLEAHRADGLILCTSKGEHMTTTAFKNALGSYVRSMEVVINGASKRWADEKTKANWKRFTVLCHDLRHTFCSMLYDAGVDVKTAQIWMGHDDLSVTMNIYTHLSQQKQDKALKSAEEHFAAYVGNNVGKYAGED